MTFDPRWRPSHDNLVESLVMAVKYLLWWHYDRHTFPPGASFHRQRVMLRAFARMSVEAVGGWREARLLLKGWVPDKGVGQRAPSRAIRIRDEDDRFTGQ